MEKMYKFRIYPNKEQEKLIQKTFGCCRFVYNYYLTKRKEVYEKEKRTFNYYDCCRDLTKIKNEYEWLREVDNKALQCAIKNLETAYASFFRDIKNGKKHSYPKYKTKKDRHKGYKSSFTNKNIEINDKSIKMPKIGWIKCKVSKKIDGRILNASITQNPSGKYFVSICCTDVEIKPLQKTGVVVGIDLGIKDFIITSDGEKYCNHKYFSKNEKKISRLQRKLSRKSNGSKNWERERIKLAKEYEKITNKRTDMIQKISTKMVNKYDVICIESLSVSNMARNRFLSKAILDVGIGDFCRKLEYKCKWYGKDLIKIDRFYPSSQICSNCGYQWNGTKNLKVRNWTCPSCGETHDRDINAAKNILNEGLRMLA